MAFLVIITLSFFFAANTLTDYVSDYLFKQRIRQDSISVERLASTVAPLFASAQEEQLSKTLSESSGELGGRLLVLDMDGKIQFDAYSAMMGQRLPLPEVASLLSGVPQAFGIYRTDPALLGSGHVACCGSLLVGSRGNLGMLLLISDMDGMIRSLENVRSELLLIFGVVALLAVLAVVLFSHILTRPLTSLTEAIRSMGRGDFSARAPVRGLGEIRRLAENYNDMAEKLEHLDQDRSAFVSNASHELKTPMASMKVLIENMIYQPDMPEEIRTDFLQGVNEQIDRLSHIVTGLLELTRMDSHRTSLNMCDVDFSSLLSDAVRLMEPAASTRSQHIESVITPGLQVSGDPDRLMEIATNLIDNALKYSWDGATVQVRLTQKQKKLYFSVEDNGVGISPDDQKHIYDRFYRVDKARSRDTGGTGLGLSIVRQLVSMHGGEITLDSTLGKGSVFTVILPLKNRKEA